MIVVAFQNHYNTPGWTSKGKRCASCGLWINELPADYSYFVGEDSAVIYGLCEGCAELSETEIDGVLNAVYEKLTGNHRMLYYSLVYGNLDSTEDWSTVSAN